MVFFWQSLRNAQMSIALYGTNPVKCVLFLHKPFILKELDARITAHLKREARGKDKAEARFQGELSIDYHAKIVQIHTDYLELTMGRTRRTA